MNFYEEKFQRNHLSKRQQETIRQKLFVIVGLGGTGGIILENLLRMGAENFLVFDDDTFVLSNFNRQILATEEFIDMPKVDAAIARANAINPEIKFKIGGEFNLRVDIGRAAVLLDGSDNIRTKLEMAQLARKKKIPFVFCSAQDSRGIVTVFTKYKFEKAFQLPKNSPSLERYDVCSSILCPASSLSGSLAVSQAVNYLLRKPYVKAPDAFFFDLFRKNPFWRAKLG